MNTEQKIAADLTACDLGMALTKGKTRLVYVQHRAACFAEIKAMNERDGMADMNDDDLLADLLS